MDIRKCIIKEKLRLFNGKKLFPSARALKRRVPNKSVLHAIKKLLNCRIFSEQMSIRYF